MPSIFISYRDKDAYSHYAFSLHVILSQYVASRVFLAPRSLQAGQVFEDELRKQIATCDCVLALITVEWLPLLISHQRSNDYVVWEIAEALRLGKQVIPVLAGGAHMPKRSALPESIQSLCGFHAAIIDDRRLEETIKDLALRCVAYDSHRQLTETQRLWIDMARKITHLVKPSYGPAGESQIYAGTSGPECSTDTVKLIESIPAVSAAESVLRDAVMRSSARVREQTGEGAATTALLAAELIQRLGDLRAREADNPAILRAMTRYIAAARLSLDNLKWPATQAALSRAALCASKGEADCASFVLDALQNSGFRGAVALAPSLLAQNSYFLKPGFFLHGCRVRPEFLLTPIGSQKVRLLFLAPLVDIVCLRPILQEVADKNETLLLVATAFANRTLKTLILNREQGTLRVLPVELAPELEQSIDDMASSCGISVFRDGVEARNAQPVMIDDLLFLQDGIAITIPTTCEPNLQRRLAEVRSEIISADGEAKKRATIRGEILSGVLMMQIAKIKPSSELELTKYRHTVRAILSARRHGILMGGGLRDLVGGIEAEGAGSPLELKVREIVCELCHVPQRLLGFVKNANDLTATTRPGNPLDVEIVLPAETAGMMLDELERIGLAFLDPKVLGGALPNFVQ